MNLRMILLGGRNRRTEYFECNNSRQNNINQCIKISFPSKILTKYIFLLPNENFG